MIFVGWDFISNTIAVVESYQSIVIPIHRLPLLSVWLLLLIFEFYGLFRLFFLLIAALQVAVKNPHTPIPLSLSRNVVISTGFCLVCSQGGIRNAHRIHTSHYSFGKTASAFTVSVINTHINPSVFKAKFHYLLTA